MKISNTVNFAYFILFFMKNIKLIECVNINTYLNDDNNNNNNNEMYILQFIQKTI